MTATLHGRRQAAALVVLGALALAPGAGAQTPANDKPFDYTACWAGISNVIAFSKTHRASSYEMVGTLHSHLPDSIFDKNTIRCVGMSAVFDGNISSSTTCEAIDRDGDKRLAHYATGSDGKLSREIVAGTGKFEGMRATTTVLPLGPFPSIKPGAIQDCSRQTGSYRLK